MAKKTIIKKAAVKNEDKTSILSLLKTRQAKTIFATFLMLFSVFLCIAFISFFFNWQEDQSTLNYLTDKTVKSKNLLGKIGANISHFFIYQGFGLAAFIISIQVFLTGFYILIQKKFSKIILSWNWGLIIMLWVSVVFGFLQKEYALLSGIIGFEVNNYLQTFIGKTGLTIVLIFLLITYLVIRYKVTFDAFIEKMKQKRLVREARRKELENDELLNETAVENVEIKEKEEAVSETINLDKKVKSAVELSLENLQPTISKHSNVTDKKEEISLEITQEPKPELKVEQPMEVTVNAPEEVEIDVEKIEEEEHSKENLSDKILKDFGEFDPTLELSNFKFPTFNLLKQYNESISIDPEELEANKNRIVETLKIIKLVLQD